MDSRWMANRTAAAALLCQQAFESAAYLFFLFGKQFLHQRVFAGVVFVEGYAAGVGGGANGFYGNGGKALGVKQVFCCFAQCLPFFAVGHVGIPFFWQAFDNRLHYLLLLSIIYSICMFNVNL